MKGIEGGFQESGRFTKVGRRAALITAALQLAMPPGGQIDTLRGNQNMKLAGAMTPGTIPQRTNQTGPSSLQVLAPVPTPVPQSQRTQNPPTLFIKGEKSEGEAAVDSSKGRTRRARIKEGLVSSISATGDVNAAYGVKPKVIKQPGKDGNGVVVAADDNLDSTQEEAAATSTSPSEHQRHKKQPRTPLTHNANLVKERMLSARGEILAREGIHTELARIVPNIAEGLAGTSRLIAELGGETDLNGSVKTARGIQRTSHLRGEEVMEKRKSYKVQTIFNRLPKTVEEVARRDARKAVRRNDESLKSFAMPSINGNVDNGIQDHEYGLWATEAIAQEEREYVEWVLAET